MRRREFIAVLGGAVVMPFAARAQQPTMPVIGFLYPGAPELSTGIVAAFRKGLDETGFVEGRNVAVDFRFAMITLGCGNWRPSWCAVVWP
jgi:putative tryptophan/tyrosine transport system substrate-binding protein